jgi:23S rRNA (uracil1939-C5)-methyltransferase
MGPMIRVTRVAVGGDGLARDDHGRVVLVTGGLPGELVRTDVVEERRDYVRATAVEIIEPAPERISPPCPIGEAGCGGCAWQHVDPSAQPRLKAAMVADALQRLGGIEHPTVDAGVELAPAGYRTTLRGLATEEGRFALRERASHELVPVAGCRVAHPLVEAVVTSGRFPPGADVTIRAGVRTGERLVIVDPSAGATTTVPEGVRVVGGDELAAGRRAFIHEEVAGRRFRISARSFFQPRPDGAEALIAAVARFLGDAPSSGQGRLVDLYGGVGLFAATVGSGWRVTVVESSASAIADARVNLADQRARVVRANVARWRPSPADAVVADPPRAGLGRQGVRAVVGTGAPRLVLVSCDAGSLGRDAALLRKAGYRFVRATIVDQFVNTPHVEVVTHFEPEAARTTPAT